MTLDRIKESLKTYDGPSLRLMEVCGSHTAAIAKSGIPGMLSPKITLLSGPGCPVCVAPSSYIDKLIELALSENITVAAFGDLLRVPGSEMSLLEARGRGASVKMIYSPFDLIPEAKADSGRLFVVAAVGFETTIPVYASFLEEVLAEGLENIRLLTALKTMPRVIDALLTGASQPPAAVQSTAASRIDGILAPGHVSVITGTKVFVPLAEKHGIPFVAAGFTGPQLLAALWELVRNAGKGVVKNAYPSVVTEEGNTSARELVDRYFETADACWRGLGVIPGSGKLLRKEYAHLDMGSASLIEDRKRNKACICGDVLMGRASSTDCPLFGTICTPASPQGACMVSAEGSCFTRYSVAGGSL